MTQAHPAASMNGLVLGLYSCGLPGQETVLKSETLKRMGIHNLSDPSNGSLDDPTLVHGLTCVFILPSYEY